MNGDAFRIEIISLVTRFRAPTPSSPRTRNSVPSGYGTREQCRPFVTAAAIGLSIPSPFAWGFCTSNEVPPNARTFCSPVSGGCTERLFYVEDDADYGFTHNQFTIPDEIAQFAGPVVVPGLSFFNRSDQQSLVKLHLPYIFRTREDSGLLFIPPLNRNINTGLTVLSGLVETGWYADAVNLVFQLPPTPGYVHITAGEPIAQVVPMSMDATRPDLVLHEQHRRRTRDTLSAMSEWKAQHDKDRSAYKRLSKARLAPKECNELVT